MNSHEKTHVKKELMRAHRHTNKQLQMQWRPTFVNVHTHTNECIRHTANAHSQSWCGRQPTLTPIRQMWMYVHLFTHWQPVSVSAHDRMEIYIYIYRRERKENIQLKTTPETTHSHAHIQAVCVCVCRFLFDTLSFQTHSFRFIFFWRDRENREKQQHL